MSVAATDDGLYERDLQRHAGMVRGSQRLLSAYWREHPAEMWQRARAGQAQLPHALRGLSLAEPVAPERRLFNADTASTSSDTFYRMPDWIPELIAAVARHFNVSVAEMRGRDRHVHLVEARRAAVIALRNRGLSYSQIARAMNRDHSSIINLVSPRRRQKNEAGGAM